MKIVIPAKLDGNTALNALAIAIKANPNILKDSFLRQFHNFLGLSGNPLGNIRDDFLNNYYLPDDSSYLDIQRGLAPALRAIAIHLLSNNERINGVCSQFLLYKAFTHAFLRYCANKFGITIAEKYYERNPNNIAMSNVYNFSKLPFVEEKFKQIFSDLIVAQPTQLQEIEGFLNLPATVSRLEAEWGHLVNPAGVLVQYLYVLNDNLSGMGEIELGLLAEKNKVTLKIKRGEGEPKLVASPVPGRLTLSLYNELEFHDTTVPMGESEKTTKSRALWGYYFEPNTTPSIGSLDNDAWYGKIKRCYQFLDKIFDDSIFNLGYESYRSIPSGWGYIDFKVKYNFFRDFRQRFNDKPSQLYGWLGLRNWVVGRDLVARITNQQDGFNHTLDEFMILADILENYPTLKSFADRTAIPGNRPPITVAEELIDIKRANFRYRTQRALLDNRNRHAIYLEYAGNPAKFVILFDLDIDSKDLKQKEKAREKLGYCKSSCTGRRWAETFCETWFVLKDAGKAWWKTDGNLFTYDGMSNRWCYSYCWLLAISTIMAIPLLLAFILPRALFSLDEEYDTGSVPDTAETRTTYEITNPAAGMIIPIAFLFLGASLIGLWTVCHNWTHDIKEREEYHLDMAKILWRTKLYNLLEHIQLKIEKDVQSGNLLPSKPTLRFALEEEFKKPNIQNEIEEGITKHINEAVEDKNPIEGITQNLGINLYHQNIRRAYIKRDVGVKIKKELVKKVCENLCGHYGFFKSPIWRETPTRPNYCMTFNSCYAVRNVDRQYTI